MDKQNGVNEITQIISPERVCELVKMAKTLSAVECQFLLGAVSLQIAQNNAKQEIEEYSQDYMG